jgi:hypothetical protein
MAPKADAVVNTAQGALMVASAVPAVGKFADVASAAISAAGGDYTDAGLILAGGVYGKGAAKLNKGLHAVEGGSDVARIIREGGEQIKKNGEEIAAVEKKAVGEAKDLTKSAANVFEESTQAVEKEMVDAAKGGDSYVYGVIDTQTGTLTKPGMSSGPLGKRMNQSVKLADKKCGVQGKHKGVIIEKGITPEQARAVEQKLTDKVEGRRPGTFPNVFHQIPKPTIKKSRK